MPCEPMLRARESHGEFRHAMSVFSFSINDLLCQDQASLKEDEKKTGVRSENKDAKCRVC